MAYNKKNNFIRKRKACQFCKKTDLVIDYKEPEVLKRYISERGKILPRRVTGACARHQRFLTTEIKKARVMALLPYQAD